MTKPTTQNRTKGKLVAAIFLCIIAVSGSTIMFFWDRGRVPRGEIITEIACSELNGKLLIRKGHKQRGFVHLVHEVDGSLQWKATLFGIQDPFSFTCQDDILTLRTTSARGGYETVAYQLTDGAYMWRTKPFEPKEVTLPWTGPRSLVHDDILIEVYDAPPEVIVLNRDDGTELSNTPFELREGAHTLDVENGSIRLHVGATESVIPIAH